MKNEPPKYTNKAIARTIPIPVAELHYFVAQVVDNIYNNEKKKTVNVKELIHRFEEIIEKQAHERELFRSKPFT